MRVLKPCPWNEFSKIVDEKTCLREFNSFREFLKTSLKDKDGSLRRFLETVFKGNSQTESSKKVLKEIS